MFTKKRNIHFTQVQANGIRYNPSLSEYVTDKFRRWIARKEEEFIHNYTNLLMLQNQTWRDIEGKVIRDIGGPEYGGVGELGCGKGTRGGREEGEELRNGKGWDVGESGESEVEKSPWNRQSEGNDLSVSTKVDEPTAEGHGSEVIQVEVWEDTVEFIYKS